MGMQRLCYHNQKTLDTKSEVFFETKNKSMTFAILHKLEVALSMHPRKFISMHSTFSDPLSLIPIDYDISSFSVLVDSGSFHYFINTIFVNKNSLPHYSVPPLQL